MLLGISGKISSGKDEFAKTFIKTLVIKHPMHRITVRKFAGKLKEITAMIIGCRVYDLESPDFKDSYLGPEWNRYKLLDFGRDTGTYVDGPDDVPESNSQHQYTVVTESLTPRILLQKLGTECGREIIHNNIWVNSLMADYNPTLNWIVTDVRFPNEAQAIKNHGGYLIRVNRNTGLTSEHPSETALDNYDGFDLIIDNNGSLEEYQEKIRSLAQKIVG